LPSLIADRDVRIKRKPTWKRPLAAAIAAIVLASAVGAAPYLLHPLFALHLLRAAPPLGLPPPVDGVLAADVVDTWGSPRGAGRRHEGIDLFAPRGSPVRSTTEGIVTRKGWNRLGGRRVLVLGPGWLSHYYAHLDAYGSIEVGDAVGPGDLLGFVGNSGDAEGTPPHLHYGVYSWLGRALDPYPFLVRAHR
jgi:murein DD-endopeptidase MepM/ murein hydrolase activator NlpD